MSPTSSRNSVPPSARSNVPIFSAESPDTAEFRYPNNSGSMKSSGIAAQLTSVNTRSEEHTSELQSPYDLVCRLLLEKKKTNHRSYHIVPSSFTRNLPTESDK